MFEGAPTAVTAFFSITPKSALLVVIVSSSLSKLLWLYENGQTFLIFCSIASMVLGLFFFLLWTQGDLLCQMVQGLA